MNPNDVALRTRPIDKLTYNICSFTAHKHIFRKLLFNQKLCLQPVLQVAGGHSRMLEGCGQVAPWWRGLDRMLMERIGTDLIQGSRLRGEGLRSAR